MQRMDRIGRWLDGSEGVIIVLGEEPGYWMTVRNKLGKTARVTGIRQKFQKTLQVPPFLLNENSKAKWTGP